MDKLALIADRTVREFYDSSIRFIGKMPDIVWEAVPVALAAYREEVNHLRHIIEQQGMTGLLAENAMVRESQKILGKTYAEDAARSLRVQLKLVVAWLAHGRTQGGETLTSAKHAAEVLLRDGIDWYTDWENDPAWEAAEFSALDPQSRRAAGQLFDEFFSSGLYAKSEHNLFEALQVFCEERQMERMIPAVKWLLYFYEYDGSASGFGGRKT